ncbi:PREDICTED: uncharacterized protein LOC109583828 isoform X2 [Amphimedon queenslandica]|uniref:FZ domain-containing protein n=1 Tax=Amphimedon queenslandica TaxID=400682 RepID=A0AAN0JDQ2_AMPQE|nr:PREDICTED: uncharacterized protein LOC109583828 isoform X2 [Amphimedon queenslandica]|eukprot:XP_019854872.1 PREDICTED: uncharacterized protein LOC109583828 isoform X2 [Amphimedon queenslandica]
MCYWNRNKQKSVAIGKKIENIAFIVTIVIVLGLFTLPIIFYFTSSHNRDTFNNVSIYYKGWYSNINDISQNCTRLSWSQDNDASECHEYTGTACRNFLHQWFQCTIGEGELNIGVSQQEQNQHEQTITSLNSYLEYCKQCQQQSSAFICQYFFPLADCSTGKSYKATKEDCLLISTGVCSDLWTLANNFSYGSLLPDCSTLPNAVNDSSSVTILIEDMNDSNGTEGIACREDFVEIDLICEPRCDSFEQTGSHLDSQLLIYSEVVATSIALTFCIIAIIVAVKEYKILLAYPSILVLFQVIDVTVLVIVLIITAIDRYGLYCSSVSLLETLKNPTPFCKFSGVIFQYNTLNMVLWWFFYGVIIFHKILFPFQAKNFENMGYNKYIFITVVTLCLVIPLPAVIISLTVERFGYNIYRFPTTLCISSGDMWFYSTTLPMDVLVAAGVIMLIIIFWTIRRSSFKINQQSISLTTAEKKIVMVIISFVIFGVYILGNTSGAVAKSNEFKAALTQYFECEAFGHVPGKCDRGTFDKIYNPYLNAISYILIGLVPLSILNFIIKWHSVKSLRTKARKLTKTSIV